MMLCRTALGRIGQGQVSLRLPPKGAVQSLECINVPMPHSWCSDPNALDAPAGFDSVSATGNKSPQPSDIFAVFDNAQSYPEYIIHYD